MTAMLIDRQRELTFVKQFEIGVIPKGTSSRRGRRRFRPGTRKLRLRHQRRAAIQRRVILKAAANWGGLRKA